MKPLEKIFVGTLLFVGLVILFLFSLWFDVAGMFRGAVVRRPDAVSVGGAENTVEYARRSGVAKEIMPKSLPVPAPVHRRKRGGGHAAYYRRPVQRTPEDLAEAERKRLMSQGFSSREYIELRAAAVRDRALVRASFRDCAKAGTAVAKLQVVREAIGRCDSKSLIPLGRLYELLREVLLTKSDLAGAEAATLKIIDLEVAVCRIEATEPKLLSKTRRINSLRKKIGGVAAAKDRVRKAFAKLRKVKAERGSLRPTVHRSEVEKTTQAIKRAFQEGKITRKEMLGALAFIQAELKRQGSK